MAARPGFELAAVMGYEAHIAGLGDRPLGKRAQEPAIRWIKKRSVAEIAERRAAVVAAVRDACRSPWQLAWTTGLLQARPDAVLVGLGMPDDAALARAAAGPQARWAMGLSASRVSAEAVADRLVRG